MPDPTVSEPEFWEDAYRNGTDRWELGDAAPPLRRALRALAPGEAALVLGCGRGHEARLAAEAGWKRVVAVDFAPVALEEARRLSSGFPAADRIEWRVQDLFTLGHTDRDRFDLAVEHACFCAIDPLRRAEWMDAVRASLRPGGRLVGLFSIHGRPGGPPFSTGRDEVLRMLAGAGFHVEEIEIPVDSVPQRQTEEMLVVARKRT